MNKFKFEIDKRTISTIISIQEEHDGEYNGIGSIFLSEVDDDLIPHVQTLIDSFNAKYAPEFVQTTYGRTSDEGQSIPSTTP